MKEITREDVEYVADLARIELTEAEKQEMTTQLARILHHIEKLNELDTENIEPQPTSSPSRTSCGKTR